MRGEIPKSSNPTPETPQIEMEKIRENYFGRVRGMVIGCRAGGDELRDEPDEATEEPPKPPEDGGADQHCSGAGSRAG